MKKYRKIGFTLWTIVNALLTLRLWDYLPITPLFTVQIIISICCSILFCIEFSSKTMRIIENIVVVFLIFIAFCYIIHFRQPVGLITLISSATLIIKNILCERKKQSDRISTKVVSLITLSVMLMSIGFTVREFTVSKQTGLANGETAVWSTVDENFFDELAKDCTTQEEVVRKGYEWIVDNIRYDYSYPDSFVYQHFNIEKTLDTKMGVCFDYSCLFASYCRTQGIPCFIIDGRPFNPNMEYHTWNRVYFNGSWWQLDLTFDSIQIKQQGQLYGFRRIESVHSQDEEYIITRIYRYFI